MRPGNPTPICLWCYNLRRLCDGSYRLSTIVRTEYSRPQNSISRIAIMYTFHKQIIFYLNWTVDYTSSVGEMLDELQWHTLEARRDQSSMLFFHKTHYGTMSIDKDKYWTPSQSTRSIRSSHNSQYCKPQTYSDALKYFSPRTISHWNSLAPSVVAAETTEEFRALI